jgi:hypothetical protein
MAVSELPPLRIWGRCRPGAEITKVLKKDQYVDAKTLKKQWTGHLIEFVFESLSA